MMLAGLGILAAWLWSLSLHPRDGLFGREDRRVWFSLLLVFFPVTGIWAAARRGLIAFRPEEITFLFPAPVGSRTLLLNHILGAMVKAASAGFFFALFIRPGTISFAWAVFCYGLYMALVVLLQVFVDLRFMGLPPRVRSRRSARLGLALLALAAAAVLAAWYTDEGRVSGNLLRWVVAPAQPIVELFLQPHLSDAWPSLAGILAVMGILGALILRHPGDIREASHATSLRVEKLLKRIRSGRAVADTPKQTTRGWVLPMLPRLGGAGVHAWRQLSVLLRTRRSFVLLIFMTLMIGALPQLLAEQPDAQQAALSILAVLVMIGPMYIQCDFRSDYECLAWLRSLPTAPGVLAAGQLLASAIVLWLLQLVLGGWIVFVSHGTERWVWISVLLALPIFDLLQLSVWNGAYLLFPFRMSRHEGPPGMAQMVRTWMVFLAVVAVLGTALVVASLPGVLIYGLLGEKFGVLEVGNTLGIVAGIASLAALIAVTAVCIWLVGRIFVRVDPSRDLG